MRENHIARTCLFGLWLGLATMAVPLKAEIMSLRAQVATEAATSGYIGEEGIIPMRDGVRLRTCRQRANAPSATPLSIKAKISEPIWIARTCKRLTDLSSNRIQSFTGGSARMARPAPDSRQMENSPVPTADLSSASQTLHGYRAALSRWPARRLRPCVGSASTSSGW